MLREIQHVSQQPGKPRRRWFSDDNWDLYVWENESDIAGFQLCYAKSAYQRALTWMEGGTPYHTAVQDDPVSGRNRAPILVADGTMPIHAVRDRFRLDSAEIDSRVQQYVITKLEDLERDWPSIGI